MAILSTEPIDVRLTASGDIEVDPINGVQFSYGLEGVGWLVSVNLKLFQGEWLFDEEAGMPYFQSILGEKFDANALRDAATKVILGTPYVTGIRTLEVSFDNTIRKASLSGQAITEFGDIEISEEIP